MPGTWFCLIEGIYEIYLEGELAKKVKITEPFEITDGSSKMEWMTTGQIRITCDTIDKLQSLQIIAQIAMRRGSVMRNRASPSKWRPFTLHEVSLEEDGKPMEKGPLFVADAAAAFDEFDTTICKQTATELFDMEFESLLFLIRSTDLVEAYSELSVLSALLGLEKTLADIIPAQRKFQDRVDRIAILDYLKVMPVISMEKVRALNHLRNCLAHRSWDDLSVGQALTRLLKGDSSKWILPKGRMNKESGRRALEETIGAIVMLRQRRQFINQTLEKLSELQRTP